MPSGRISKQDQETLLDALERRLAELRTVLAETKGDSKYPGAVVWNIESKIAAIVDARHTIRDTMETYEPCSECGGTGYVVIETSNGILPDACPLCYGNPEQPTCPQCATPLRQGESKYWNCPACGWSSIKVVTK